MMILLSSQNVGNSGLLLCGSCADLSDLERVLCRYCHAEEIEQIVLTRRFCFGSNFLEIVFLGLLVGFLLASVFVEMAVSEKSAINSSRVELVRHVGGKC